MGRFRFFGQVSHEELDRSRASSWRFSRTRTTPSVSINNSLSNRGGRGSLAGRCLNHPHGHRLTEQHRLLGLISLATGYDYDNVEILVQEDEYDWPFDKFFPI